MNKRKLLSILLAALLLAATVSGCGTQTDNTSSVSPGATQSANELVAADMFTDNDLDASWDSTTAAEITLSDTGSSSASQNVNIDDSTVTISAEGTYVLSGNLKNGQIVVEAPDTAKVQLVLNGVTVNSDTSAALYIKQADKVFLTLAEGSKNTLTTAKEYVAIDDNNIDAAVFSKEDLTINGTGTLTVSSAFGHGIVSKDDLVLADGTYTITSAKHGLAGKDSVRIADGSYTISSGKDGIHAENADDTSLGFLFVADGSFSIRSTTDGMDAASILQVENGTFDIISGGGSANAEPKQQEGGRPDFQNRPRPDTSGGSGQSIPGQATESSRYAVAQTSTGDSVSSQTVVAADETPSTKGLKAGSELILKAGSFVVDSADDTLHSNANVFVYDGMYTLSTGDDGIHADTHAAVYGGTVQITKSYEGIEGQSVEIAGGTISITASDDGLNAAGGNDASGTAGGFGGDSFTADADCYIHITGGQLVIDAEGDGIDSNGDLVVSGGETYVNGPSNNGNGALDYNGSAKITGGIVVAVGSSGMAQNFGSESTQGSILYSSETRQSAGSVITLKDASGKTIATHTASKEFNSVVVSTPDIQQGADYTLEMGDETENISMTELVYGSGGGMGGMPGGGGQRGPGAQGGNPGGPAGGTASGLPREPQNGASAAPSSQG